MSLQEPSDDEASSWKEICLRIGYLGQSVEKYGLTDRLRELRDGARDAERLSDWRALLRKIVEWEEEEHGSGMVDSRIDLSKALAEHGIGAAAAVYVCPESLCDRREEPLFRDQPPPCDMTGRPMIKPEPR